VRDIDANLVCRIASQSLNAMSYKSFFSFTQLSLYLFIFFFRQIALSNCEAMRTVCLCSGSNSDAGTHFLPRFQKGVNRKTLLWVVGQSPTKKGITNKKRIYIQKGNFENRFIFEIPFFKNKFFICANKRECVKVGYEILQF